MKRKREEKRRRWLGYVCPHCRFVFRVQQDHDGIGAVCNSCRRVMKIPKEGETTASLLFEKAATGSGTALENQAKPKTFEEAQREAVSAQEDKAKKGLKIFFNVAMGIAALLLIIVVSRFLFVEVYEEERTAAEVPIEAPSEIPKEQVRVPLILPRSE